MNDNFESAHSHQVVHCKLVLVLGLFFLQFKLLCVVLSSFSRLITLNKSFESLCHRILEAGGVEEQANCLGFKALILFFFLPSFYLQSNLLTFTFPYRPHFQIPPTAHWSHPVDLIKMLKGWVDIDQMGKRRQERIWNLDIG